MNNILPTITKTVSDTRSPEQKTENKKAQVKMQASRNASMHITSAIRTQQDGIKSAFHNPDLSPQEYFDALGTGAVQVCQGHALLTEYLAKLQALTESDYGLLYPTFKLEPQADGTVKVTDQPYA